MTKRLPDEELKKRQDKRTEIHLKRIRGARDYLQEHYRYVLECKNRNHIGIITSIKKHFIKLHCMKCKISWEFVIDLPKEFVAPIYYETKKTSIKKESKINTLKNIEISFTTDEINLKLLYETPERKSFVPLTLSRGKSEMMEHSLENIKRLIIANAKSLV